MRRPTTQAISPFFIVSNVDQTIAFYRDKLGFETRLREPAQDPFFAIICRDGAQLLVTSKGHPRLTTLGSTVTWHRTCTARRICTCSASPGLPMITPRRSTTG